MAGKIPPELADRFPDAASFEDDLSDTEFEDAKSTSAALKRGFARRCIVVTNMPKLAYGKHAKVIRTLADVFQAV